MKKNILIIDAYNMLHRARVGQFPGEYSLHYTFFRSLRSEVEKHNADKVYYVLEGVPQARLKLNSEYKATRTSAPSKFYIDKEEINSLCTMLPISIARHEYHECDDVIAHIAQKIHGEDNIIIVSSDTDFIQIVDDRVKLWNPVKKEYRAKQEDYAKWKAFVGDKSDNISGIPGVGKLTADKLIADKQKFDEFFNKKPQYKDLYENCLKQIEFEKINDEALLTIRSFNYNPDLIRKEFERMKFNSILNKGWKKWDDTWRSLENEKRGT